MTLRQHIDADGTVNWTSPPAPLSSPFQHAYIGLSPIPPDTPPSLKNPKRVAVPTAQDGWRKGDSKKKRDAAKRDLKVIQERLMRQIGRPNIAVVAPLPVYPDMWQKLG